MKKFKQRLWLDTFFLKVLNAKDINTCFRYLKTFCEDLCGYPTITHDVVYSFNVFLCCDWDWTSTAGFVTQALFCAFEICYLLFHSRTTQCIIFQSLCKSAWMSFPLKAFKKEVSNHCCCSKFSMSTDGYARELAMICWKWNAANIEPLQRNALLYYWNELLQRIYVPFRLPIPFLHRPGTFQIPSISNSMTIPSKL